MIGRGIGIPFRRGTGGGTSIPPEIKKNIIAWYDPKKQGMTNYDVIESYVTDFTTWRTADKNYVGLTIRSSSFSISFNKVSNHVIMWKPNYLFNEEGQVKLQVSGITNNISIIIKHGTQEFPIVNGVNTFSFTQEENKSLSFVCKNVFQDTNITITQLPTSILKDFSGNGNHAYLYGGKGKLNSGMGVYQTDFTTWSKTNFDVHPEYIIATNGNGNLTLYGVKINSINVEIKGYNDKVKFLRLGYNNNDGVYKELNISNDGIYTIPGSSLGQEGRLCSISISLKEDTKITITQIPDYPDQLCYDGKMYAVAYDMPILTDYTIIADRTWFENNGNRVFITKGNIWPNCAFVFEKINASLNSETFLFSKSTEIDDLRSKSGITYQTKQSYNGVPIAVGDSSDGDVLLIGGQKSGEYIGCHGAIIIADRSFTEEEINWLKNNLFTIDIPTPAYDFDFSKYKDGSNLGDSITDKYGNVLELHNFAWKGMSGLGGYINFPTTGNPSIASWIYDNQSITFTEIINPIASQVYTWGENLEEVSSTKVNIIGLNNYKGAFILYRYWNGNALILREIYNDGEYILEKGESYNESKFGINWSIAVMNYIGKCNIKVNILPIYPGALVFDGIDDYARLAKMTIKTVVLDFVNLELDKQVYDNRDKPNNHNYFSIYPQADTVAYEARNSNGKTYINGELNTTIKTNDLLGVRCITCASNDLAKETEQYICRDSYLNNYYGKIALYRITGFTEMLTADQVWKWYQKNKAKGGDK